MLAFVYIRLMLPYSRPLILRQAVRTKAPASYRPLYPSQILLHSHRNAALTSARGHSNNTSPPYTSVVTRPIRSSTLP